MNFEINLKGLDGKDVLDFGEKTITLGKLLAAQLAGASKGDALKLFHWATKLYNGESLDLDPTDTQTLKDFVNNESQLTVLAKAQLLAVFKKD
jgi:hypothetical protein